MCACKNKPNPANAPRTYQKPVQEECNYTLEQVKNLLPLVTPKEFPYVRSQVNVYSNRCNALKDVINGLITKYLS